MLCQGCYKLLRKSMISTELHRHGFGRIPFLQLDVLHTSVLNLHCDGEKDPAVINIQILCGDDQKTNPVKVRPTVSLPMLKKVQVEGYQCITEINIFFSLLGSRITLQCPLQK